MKKIFLAVVALMLIFGASSSAGNNPWGCKERAADGQCVVTVSISNTFPDIDKQVIAEVLADFSLSPNIDVVEGKPGDVSIVQGCYRSRCGFLTDPGARKIYIDKQWSYANYCCNAHDGMRGVYCHEFMHAIAGESDASTRALPSCFNGTSPFLGPEDFAAIARTYP